jgi:hypothetical protein
MPNAWRIGELTIAGVFMGISELVFCTAVLTIAKFRLSLGIEMLRTSDIRSRRATQKQNSPAFAAGLLCEC